MSSEQYWRHQLAQSEAEYEQIIEGLRDEVEKQRRRCTELMHEQAMQRATAAVDVRNFCTQYVAEAKATPRGPSATAAAVTSAAQQSAHRGSGVESVPLPALLAFLHEYSHGLLQLPENRRKRERGDVALNPVHHRLRQRMLARHRLIGREDEALEEAAEEGMNGGRASPVGSPCSPPMGPSVGPPSTIWYANAAATTRAEAHTDPTDADVATAPQREVSAFNGGSRNSGCGGPVVAASMFGLPTLPPR